MQGNEVAITCNECEKEADCNCKLTLNNSFIVTYLLHFTYVWFSLDHGACVKGKCECYPDEQVS